MAPTDTGERRPAINHVTAGVITIDFDKQKVATVLARDSVFGVYVEPEPDSAAKKSAGGKAAPPRPKPPSTKPPSTKPPSTKPPSKPTDSVVPLLPKPQ